MWFLLKQKRASRVRDLLDIVYLFDSMAKNYKYIEFPITWTNLCRKNNIKKTIKKHTFSHRTNKSNTDKTVRVLLRYEVFVMATYMSEGPVYDCWYMWVWYQPNLKGVFFPIKVDNRMIYEIQCVMGCQKSLTCLKVSSVYPMFEIIFTDFIVQDVLPRAGYMYLDSRGIQRLKYRYKLG